MPKDLRLNFRQHCENIEYGLKYGRTFVLGHVPMYKYFNYSNDRQDVYGFEELLIYSYIPTRPWRGFCCKFDTTYGYSLL